MLPKLHHEKHFTATDTVRDAVLGMSDGLTVPFALAAGLSAAISSTHVVVTAGLAEVAAGAIAMGLGGYLAARTDTEYYHSERSREYYEVDHLSDHEEKEVQDIFMAYGLSGEVLKGAVKAVTADRDRWVDFMMKFELGLEKPDSKRALKSAVTIGGSYVVGGIIPLLPYIFITDIHDALKASSCVTGLALVVFGMIKGHLTSSPLLKSALQTLVVGGLAAIAAFGLVHTFA